MLASTYARTAQVDVLQDTTLPAIYPTALRGISLRQPATIVQLAQKQGLHPCVASPNSMESLDGADGHRLTPRSAIPPLRFSSDSSPAQVSSSPSPLWQASPQAFLHHVDVAAILPGASSRPRHSTRTSQHDVQGSPKRSARKHPAAQPFSYMLHANMVPRAQIKSPSPHRSPTPRVTKEAAYRDIAVAARAHLKSPSCPRSPMPPKSPPRQRSLSPRVTEDAAYALETISHSQPRRLNYPADSQHTSESKPFYVSLPSQSTASGPSDIPYPTRSTVTACVTQRGLACAHGALAGGIIVLGLLAFSRTFVVSCAATPIVIPAPIHPASPPPSVDISLSQALQRALIAEARAQTAEKDLSGLKQDQSRALERALIAEARAQTIEKDLSGLRHQQSRALERAVIAEARAQIAEKDLSELKQEVQRLRLRELPCSLPPPHTASLPVVSIRPLEGALSPSPSPPPPPLPPPPLPPPPLPPPSPQPSPPPSPPPSASPFPLLTQLQLSNVLGYSWTLRAIMMSWLATFAAALLAALLRFQAHKAYLRPWLGTVMLLLMWALAVTVIVPSLCLLVAHLSKDAELIASAFMAGNVVQLAMIISWLSYRRQLHVTELLREEHVNDHSIHGSSMLLALAEWIRLLAHGRGAGMM